MNENMRIEISETYLKSRTYIASPDCIVSQPNKMLNENYSKKMSLVFCLLSTTGKQDNSDNSCDESQHSG